MHSHPQKVNEAEVLRKELKNSENVLEKPLKKTVRKKEIRERRETKESTKSPHKV